MSIRFKVTVHQKSRMEDTTNTSIYLQVSEIERGEKGGGREHSGGGDLPV